MHGRAFGTAVLAYMLVGHAPPAFAQVDQQRAQEFFKEAKTLCERDGGRLWGVSICAPMVVGDARTQTFATSQAPPSAPRPRLIERRALERALGASGEARSLNVRDALAFRQARHALFPHMKEHERAVDINEGLASYTGTVLAVPG